MLILKPFTNKSLSFSFFLLDKISLQLNYMTGLSEIIQGPKMNFAKRIILGPEVIKKFILNSAEHETLAAHKCKNVNNGWHFNIYEQKINHSRLICV